MNELALFAGAGGGLLGSILNGWKTVCAVEIDAYCRQVLLQRQLDGMLEPFPIWGDIRTFDGRPWRGCVDIVTAGFPCQPFSVAGKRAGTDDERNMWPETIRVIREVRSRYAFLENVPGLLSSGYFGTILGELAESGYDARWCVLGADDVGAPHRRKRLWMLADTERDGSHESALGRSAGAGKDERRLLESQGRSENSLPDPQRDLLRHESGRFGPQQSYGMEQECQAPTEPRNDGAEESVADAAQQSEREQNDQASTEPREGSWLGSSGRGWWQSEPDVGRVAHGVASRVDRLKALGNGQIPAVVREAWQILNGSQEE